MNPRQPLAVAVGDPSGVGPAVAVDAAALWLARDDATPLCLFGDARWLAERWQRLHGELSARLVLREVEPWSDWQGLHAPTVEAGRAQLRILKAARHCVATGAARALVTGPMSKAAVQSSGQPFTGQTEFLAMQEGLAADAVTMLFLGPKLCVGLVTTHLALRAVPAAISVVRVQRTVRHLAQALRRRRPAGDVRIVVTGLNPHAGEQGLLGDEEQNVIAPAVAELCAQGGLPGVQLEGPTAAETAFRQAQAGLVDGVVAMAHDQATIAAKLLDWGQSVNVTWGLPYVRTSVDHGVAYDAARADNASPEGMLAAIAMADALSARG